MRKFLKALVGASAAALVVATSTLAGTGVGDVFNLGQTNTVDAQSVLAGNTAGAAQLRVQNNAGDTALSLVVDPGIAPFKVNSGAKVSGLNSDLVDGFGASDFWHLTGNAGTPAGSFIGTTDARGFTIKTNNKQAIYVDPNQNLYVSGRTTAYNSLTALIGTSSPCAPLVVVLSCANATGVAGMLGQSSGAGVQIGVQGSSNTVTCPVGGSTGVAGCSGIGNNVGVLAPSSNQVGVRGISDAGVGVSGASNSGRAVEGLAKTGVGVWGSSSNNDGVHGYSPVLGAAGVHGDSTNGDGVLGTSTNGPGIYGYGGSGSAAYFEGDITVSGTMHASAKQFRIDDPLDPAHKYLQHTSVESSDMMDIYNGNVTTDARGFATVRLPSWFQALNRSFRYQLTVLGHSFAQAIVWREIHGNRFTIRTNQPSVKVSWLVTGIRHDPYANANRTAVIVSKPTADQGKYLNPQLYGKPRREAIGFRPQDKGGRQR